MSNKVRKGTRGNAQRGAGPRLSNAPGFSGGIRGSYATTPAPPSVAPSEEIEREAVADPTPSSPVVFDGSILSKPLVVPPVALEPVASARAIARDEGARDEEEGPLSSTRSREGVLVEKVVVHADAELPETNVTEGTPPVPVSKAKRAERRSRDRGKGARSSASPSAPARGAPPASSAVPSTAASTPPPVSMRPTSPASIPPASAPPTSSDLDEKFFEEGAKSERSKARSEVALAHDDLVQEYEGVTDPKILHKMLPEVRARRAKYARYVTIVSTGCVLLAIAALVKHKIARGDQEVAARDMAAYAAAHSPDNSQPNSPNGSASPSGTAAPVPTPSPSDPAPQPSAAAAASAPPPADSPPIAAEARTPAGVTAEKGEAKADAPVTGAQAADTETPHAKTAAQEKRDCQVLLDRGAFGRAIEAGQRSVGLDPTDGEAWLLLGAAYQSQGRVADARRSFNACLKEGKKGPLGECKAMLQ